MTVQELRAKGYNYAQAARKCGVTRVHVYLVMNGKRKSDKLMAKLQALPVLHFPVRERVAR